MHTQTPVAVVPEQDTSRLIDFLPFLTDIPPVSRHRSRLNDGSRDIISLEALLGYLLESLENIKIPAPPRDPDGYEGRRRNQDPRR